MEVWVLKTRGWESQDIEILGVYVNPEKAKAVAEQHFEDEHRAFFKTEGGKWSFWDNSIWSADFPKVYDAYHGYAITKYEVEE